MRTVNAAIAYNENLRLSGSNIWGGFCEKLVRTSYGENAQYYPSATAHWNAIPAKYKHSGKPRRGGLAFWLQKSGTGDGHVTLCVNDIGGVNSNDIVSRGIISRVDYTVIEQKWTNLKYVGWADPWWNEDNKVIIPIPVAKPVYNYRQGKRVYSNKMHLRQANSDSVWNLSLALHVRGYFKPVPTTTYSPELKNAVAAFQRRQGWSGSDADGIAGPQTTKKLGLVWSK